MKTYRELEVYKISQELAIKIHAMSLALPKFELYEEGGQIRRSSKAATSAIVEGYGRRNYKKDFIKFLVIAITECDETIVHLDFLFKTESLKDEILYTQLHSSYTELSKRINKFIQWVEKNWKSRE
jgi:four helix bundle protein